MTVEILLKNNRIMKFENVRKVSNMSSRINNDRLLIYFNNHPDIRPMQIDIRDIDCVEVIGNDYFTPKRSL